MDSKYGSCQNSFFCLQLNTWKNFYSCFLTSLVICTSWSCRQFSANMVPFACLLSHYFWVVWGLKCYMPSVLSALWGSLGVPSTEKVTLHQFRLSQKMSRISFFLLGTFFVGAFCCSKPLHTAHVLSILLPCQKLNQVNEYLSDLRVWKSSAKSNAGFSAKLQLPREHILVP